jgi:deoxyuridine 5'-triphosphate nucleotidohydrolase
MIEKNINEELEELKKLLVSEESENDYTELFDKLGLDMKIMEENSFSTVTLEYKSDTDKELAYAYPTDRGVKFNIPPFYEIQVRSKSGLAINKGLMVLNSPGTVDQGYTGEVKVIVFNASNLAQTVEKGTKIAQAVLSICIPGKSVNLKMVNQINQKDRNENGFGSTGV